MRAAPTALLLDLDGVVRVFPTPPLAAAFEWTRLLPAITGQVTHEEWLSSTVDALVSEGVSPASAAATVDEWAASRGSVVPEALHLVREVRALGLPVVLATNATTRLDEDLAAVGLAGEFDAVVNSSAIGHHKPTREFFQAACVAAGRPPDRCLFVDDDDRNLRGARVVGLAAYRWSDPARDVPYILAALTAGLATR